MTLANASLKGGHPTGVTLFDTDVLINTVASPANSIRTSLPACFSAAAQTKGKFARVGFSDPTRPTKRNFCPSAVLFGLADSVALAVIDAAQACAPFFKKSRRFVKGRPPIDEFKNEQSNELSLSVAL
jgi:hypothetical protein